MKENVKQPKASAPGEGIRTVRTTNVFRLLNFELYTKPNKIIMVLGVTCFASVLGYIAYMRTKYESLGYYAAMQSDGKETFIKKESKWES